jgi:hypothetical protein
MLAAAEILAISEPERLFGTSDAVHDGYHSLAKRWHPDAPSGDATVFAHINDLHSKAKKLLANGVWHVPGLLEFTAAGKQYRVRYVHTFEFELGKAFLGKTLLTYVIRKEFADLVEKARVLISKLHYPDRKTKEVMARYLPKLTAYHETATDVVMTLDKPADLIRMRDLRDHLGGKIDPKHVAWIVSRLLNHTSYLEWAQLTHNDISLDSLFICPEHHTVCLLGGWWYATATTDRLTALPARTLNYASREMLAEKKPSLRIDPELARLTARELLGDATGVHLMNDPNLPRSMVDWLRLSGSGSAMQDYTQWRDSVLMKSFGPRKFVKFSVSADEVYPNLKT